MKSKKKLKGMTLVEIIIAMAVFGMLGVILLGIGQVIDSTTKSSSRFNKKMAIEAPYAASKDVYDNSVSKQIDLNNDGIIDDADQCYYYIDKDNNKIIVTPEKMDIQISFKDSKGDIEKVDAYRKATSSDPDSKKIYKLDTTTKKYVKVPEGTGDYVYDKVEAKSDMQGNKYSTDVIVKGNESVNYYDNSQPDNSEQNSKPNAKLNFQFIDDIN